MMMIPPSACARVSASADLPLVVGPARRMAIGGVTLGDYAQPAEFKTVPDNPVIYRRWRFNARG